MLIDFDVLKKFGTTNQAIRDLFTLATDDPKYALRKKWEDRIQGRIQEGAIWGLKNHQFFQAADLAWDSNLITKELVPLSLYAQGKITFKNLEESLKEISPELSAKFVKKDAAGKGIGIDLPAFHKVVVNLVRSLITKRTASLVIRYEKQFPLFKYEPLGTSYVSRLRGDVLSQRVEMMTNQYGYRHDLEQAVRDMLLYSFSLEFPRSAWDRERAVRKKVRAEGFDSSTESDFEVETYIAREGLTFKRPHPTRIFYDMAFPLSSINTDTGVTFLGHWNVVPYRDVSHNKLYFNNSKVGFDTSFASRLVGYRNYWALYFSNSAINFPNGTSPDVVGLNEREKITGYYSTEHDDRTIMLTEYFERVIPRDVGLGDYPFPVWVRLVVAADRTVVFGEIMPCAPATYWAYNCSDSKVLNNAYAHDVMPWQDQMSNMFTNLLFAQKAGLIKVMSMDLDLINDPELVKQIREIASGESIYTKPLLVEYKGVQAAEMGLDPRRVIAINETTALADPTLYFRSILQVLSLAERMLGTSANESAQSEPREVSATESSTIAQSVNTGIGFMSAGIDEAISAKKRQVYEALIACGHSRIVVPVANRYTNSTIKAAGFEPMTEEQEGEGMSENYSATEPRRVTVMGEKQALMFDYNFSARDGSERPTDPKAAEVLVRLLQPLVQMPGLVQAMGKTGMYDFMNSIIRLSGAGVDVKFETQDGEGDEMPSGDAVTDNKAALEDTISKLIGAIEQDRAEIAAIKQSLGMQQAAPQQPAPPQEAPPP